MKILVTHNYPDWDAITSVWLIKRYLPGWEDAQVEFVPHGSRISEVQSSEFVVQSEGTRKANNEQRIPSTQESLDIDPEYVLSTDEVKNKADEVNSQPIEMMGEDEVIHVDTGYGALDHHQDADMTVCATSLVFHFIKSRNTVFEGREDKWVVREDALGRITQYNVELDHFQEVFWPDAAADRYEFSFFGLLEGYKAEVHDNKKSLDFGFTLLDAALHRFESRIWAEREIAKKGRSYDTKFGKVLGIETINDEVIKLAQRMGYAIVVRKDPKRGHVRIKALPERALLSGERGKDKGASDSTMNYELSTMNQLDLTPLYERLQKIDPRATWFLHASKRMILNSGSKLNGSTQTTLPLDSVMQVLLELYR